MIVVRPKATSQENLYRHTVTALQDSIERLAETSSTRLRSSDQRFIDCVASLKTIFDSAVLYVSTEWDMERRDPVAVLPAELSAECFRLLDLQDCIRVSQVSCAWRCAALEDRRLWDHYQILGHHSPRKMADILVRLLARSDPLPFHLHCSIESQYIPAEVYDIVCANMHRMRELGLENVLSRLLQLEAPMLKNLTSTTILENDGSGATDILPAQWGARNAPRLEIFRAEKFSLSPDCEPFAALHTLHATLPSSGTFGAPLLRVFPNLTALSLENVTRLSLDMISHLPPSLQSIDLCSSNELESLDYGSFFSNLRSPSSLRLLNIGSCSSVLDALAHFRRLYDGPGMMSLWENVLELKDASGDVSWRIWSTTSISLRRDPGCVAYIGRLSKLELFLPEFLYLQKTSPDAWDRRLPSLCSLELLVDEETPQQRQLLSSDGILMDGIQMPALQIVTFFTWFKAVELTKWLSAEVPALLPVLLARHSGEKPLARIRIRCEALPQLSRRDVAPFLLFTERVSVGTSEKPNEADLVFEAQCTTTATD